MGARVKKRFKGGAGTELSYDLAILLLGVYSRIGSRGSDMYTIMSLVICRS